MSSIPNNNCCNTENSVCHAAKGTGYLVGSSGAYLAAIGVAILVVTAVAGMFASDALFLTKHVMFAPPISMVWVVPVTLGCVVFHYFLAEFVIETGTMLGKGLLDQGNEWGSKMIREYRSVCA